MLKEFVCVKKLNLSWNSFISRGVKCRIIEVKKTPKEKKLHFSGVVDYQEGEDAQRETGGGNPGRQRWVQEAKIAHCGFPQLLGLDEEMTYNAVGYSSVQ